MNTFEITPAAWREIEDIYVYISIDSPQSASRFLDKCQETFTWLADSPNVGRPWRGRDPRTRGVRVWSVAGFPNHLIFYRPRRGSILILHVLSGARDLDRQMER